MVMEMNLLSLNSDGAFRTMMQRRMPHSRNRNSTVGGKKEKQIYYSDGRHNYNNSAVPLGKGVGNGSRGHNRCQCLPDGNSQTDRHITWQYLLVHLWDGDFGNGQQYKRLCLTESPGSH